jgi:hypothetical protein
MMQEIGGRLLGRVAQRVAGRPQSEGPRSGGPFGEDDPRDAERRANLLTRVIISVIAIGVIVAGCGNDNDPQHENRLPTAQLTAGPVEGDTTSYQVRLFWTGNDPDGYVSAYEIAVDPPGELSTAQWERTANFSRLFRFSTTEAESTGSGSSMSPTGRFFGMHVVYVRAVDDEGAVSAPAHIAVTAQSVAPVTTITRPELAADILIFGSSMVVDWSGEDTDPAGAGPLRYEYKLVDLKTLVPPPSLLLIVCPGCLLRQLDSGPWIPASEDSLPLRLPLDVNSEYLFAVRAINAAGATEPFFDLGRNAFKFETFAKAGVPWLTLTCELGTYTSIGINNPIAFEGLVSTAIHFTVSASAVDYGETIAGWRWGIDLPNIESEDGWSPWTTDPTLPPISYAQSGVHVLHVETRDTAGGLTRATVILRMISAPMDRALLWVDDSLDHSFPSDTQHDVFWDGLFRDSGRFEMASDVFKYEVYGGSDVFSPTPIPPTLEELARHRLVIWECSGSGYNGMSGLSYVTLRQNTLASYLRAGGELWVDGTLTVAAMGHSASGIGADLNYPKDLTVAPNSFAYHFMKLASTRIMNAKGVPVGDNLVGVKPFPGRSETYPQMDQDSNKIDLIKASVSHCDAIFDPIYLQDAGLAGVLDSLYVYQAKSATSSYQNKLNAVRWHDPDPAREHGRTQWFGFPLYYMKKDQAQVTFNRAVDWFRQEVRP